MKNLYLTLMMIAIFSVANVYSNNLRVTSVERGTTNKDEVTFTLAWDNSWDVGGTPSNHDAAWVFIKFKECGTEVWHHALLSTTMSDHSSGSNLDFAKDILATNRLGAGIGHNTGAILKRSGVGSGNISGSVTLKIVGSTSSTPFDIAKDYEIRVFGVEMVQVKEGSFKIGDGRLSDGAGSHDRLGYRNVSNANYIEPYIVLSENAITTGDAIPLWDASAVNANIDIAADFPKGYGEFYCMKYEITQGQYADFLNLNPILAATAAHGTNRYAIKMGADGGYQADDPNRVCNYINYDDVLSYLDWAALRPMTEMEYEKACRGFMAPTTYELAWGTTNLYMLDDVSTPEDGTDTAIVHSSFPYINCNTQWNTINGDVNQKGPVGAGIFARDNTLTREATGASYWGIMEMTGNVAELTIPVTTTPVDMSGYDGIWGDGILDGAGKFNVSNWPASPVARQVGLYRGAYFYNSCNNFRNYFLRVSNRSHTNSECWTGYIEEANERHPYQGGRGVR